MTVREVATYLKVDERTVYRLAREGRLPATKLGGQWRFRRDLIDEWMELSMRRPPGPPASAPEEDLPEEITAPEYIRPALTCRGKIEAVTSLVEALSTGGAVASAGALLEAVLEREKLLPTYVGEGIALPHARSVSPDVVNRAAVALGIVRSGIPWGSRGEEARIIALPCAPTEALHLKLLALTSKALRDKRTRDAVLSAGEPRRIADAFLLAARAKR